MWRKKLKESIEYKKELILGLKEDLSDREKRIIELVKQIEIDEKLLSEEK